MPMLLICADARRLQQRRLYMPECAAPLFLLSYRATMPRVRAMTAINMLILMLLPLRHATLPRYAIATII